MNKLKLFTISAFLLTPIVLITCNDQDPQQTAPTTTITTITPEKALAKIKEVSLKIKNEQGKAEGRGGGRGQIPRPPEYPTTPPWKGGGGGGETRAGPTGPSTVRERSD